MTWKFRLKYWKLKFRYWRNKNSGKPIFYQALNIEERQNGKTQLIIKDALKHKYPIIVEDRMSKIILSKRIQEIIGNKKKVEDMVIIVTPDSILVGSFMKPGTKVLLDCGYHGLCMTRDYGWKIVNGFVRKN